MRAKRRRFAHGESLTDAEIDKLSDEIAAGRYEEAFVQAVRRGRPAMGSGPASVVPVRIDPDLKAAVVARAAADDTTVSELIREAIRRYIDVA